MMGRRPAGSSDGSGSRGGRVAPAARRRPRHDPASARPRRRDDEPVLVLLKQEEAVAHQRLGRLKEKYWRASHACDVTLEVQSKPQGKARLKISWQRTESFAQWNVLAWCSAAVSNSSSCSRIGVDVVGAAPRDGSQTTAAWAVAAGDRAAARGLVRRRPLPCPAARPTTV